MSYNDPWCAPNDPKYVDLIERLQATKHAILTKDRLVAPGGPFERLGYIALFEIDDVESREELLRFYFTNRVADLF